MTGDYMREVMSGRIDVEVIEDLVEDMTSWGDFYIAFEDDLKDRTLRFLQDLEWHDIDFVKLEQNNIAEFENSICDEDVLLAISRGGDDEFVLEMAKLAKSRHAKVYGICEDDENDLALLADESLTHELDFFTIYPVYLQAIVQMITSDSHKKEEEIKEPVRAMEEPVRVIEDPDKKPQGNVFPEFSGLILEIYVNVGDEVKVGDRLYLIERMKMHTEIFSEIEGTVKEIFVKPGDVVYPDEDCIMNIVGEDEDSVESEDSSQGQRHLNDVLDEYNELMQKLYGGSSQSQRHEGDVLAEYDDFALEIDEEFINDFVDDVTSWSTIYVVCDDDLRNFVRDFQNELESMGIETIMISEGLQDEFGSDIDEDDVLLVISEECNEDFITSIVKTAKSNRPRVYAICGDVESGLAVLCDETFTIEKEFKASLPSVLKEIIDNLDVDFEDEEIKIMEAHNAAKLNPNAPGNVLCKVHGVLVEVCVGVGDKVSVGDKLCVVEVMKMEMDVLSEVEGTVKFVNVNPGDFVNLESILMNIG